MASDADQLARFRVALETGNLPSDVGRWALQRLVGGLAAAERHRARNRYLRAAGELVEGSERARARRLVSEMAALSRRTTTPDPLRRLLAAALEVDPECPRSVAQIRRILGGS